MRVHAAEYRTVCFMWMNIWKAIVVYNNSVCQCENVFKWCMCECDMHNNRTRTREHEENVYCREESLFKESAIRAESKRTPESGSERGKEIG